MRLGCIIEPRQPRSVSLSSTDREGSNLLGNMSTKGRIFWVELSGQMKRPSNLLPMDGFIVGDAIIPGEYKLLTYKYYL